MHTILFVDDEYETAKSFKDIFEFEFDDFDVEIATNSEDAINIIKKNQNKVFVAVVDMALEKDEDISDPISGLKLIKTIKAIDSAIQVIIYTGFEKNHSLKYCIKAGAMIYVIKGKDTTRELLIQFIDQAYERYKETDKSNTLLADDNRLLKEHEELKISCIKQEKCKVFIGHGRSPLWQELSQFLSIRLKLEYDEYNRESSAGLSIKERLEVMLGQASFALLIMTAEDEHADSTKHARENVIHEIGLFQGHLGFKKAIILLEDGCQEFSNIHGVGQIRFPEGNIRAAFEDIRQVLERELITSSDFSLKK